MYNEAKGLDEVCCIQCSPQVAIGSCLRPFAVLVVKPPLTLTSLGHIEVSLLDIRDATNIESIRSNTEYYQIMKKTHVAYGPTVFGKLIES